MEQSAVGPLPNNSPNYDVMRRVLQVSLEQMEQGFATLDYALKASYLEALELEPGLVERETPHINFLRTEDFRPLDAAKRLATYWKYRKQVFGERWLLPMNQVSIEYVSWHRNTTCRLTLSYFRLVPALLVQRIWKH